MSFQKLQWIFPLAVTLHNSEEALFMPNWVAAHSRDLPLQPSALTILSGLLLLTLAAFVVTYLCGQNGRETVWADLLFGYLSAMLVNVFAPQLPATLVFREYTPGIATAIVINLPVMSILMFKAVRDQWVSGVKASAYALLVPLAIGAGILLLFLLAP